MADASGRVSWMIRIDESGDAYTFADPGVISAGSSGPRRRASESEPAIPIDESEQAYTFADPDAIRDPAEQDGDDGSEKPEDTNQE